MQADGIRTWNCYFYTVFVLRNFTVTTAVFTAYLLCWAKIYANVVDSEEKARKLPREVCNCCLFYTFPVFLLFHFVSLIEGVWNTCPSNDAFNLKEIARLERKSPSTFRRLTKRRRDAAIVSIIFIFPVWRRRSVQDIYATQEPTAVTRYRTLMEKRDHLSDTDIQYYCFDSNARNLATKLTVPFRFGIYIKRIGRYSGIFGFFETCCMHNRMSDIFH